MLQEIVESYVEIQLQKYAVKTAPEVLLSLVALLYYKCLLSLLFFSELFHADVIVLGERKFRDSLTLQLVQERRRAYYSG